MAKSELSPEQRQENLVSPERERHHLFIGLQGGIGAGKTELAQLISRRFGISLLEERFRENPFLAMFCDNPRQYSLASQTFFLKEKIEQMVQAQKSLEGGALVIDQTLCQDVEIFAWVHRQMGWMDRLEYEKYLQLLNTLVGDKVIPEPDVVISVHAPVRVMIDRIKKRGREYELQMLAQCPEYFARIVNRVKEWVRENPHNLPIIVVDSREFNYVDDPIDALKVISHIQEKVETYLEEREDIILPSSFKPGPMRDSRAGKFSQMDNPLRRRI